MWPMPHARRHVQHKNIQTCVAMSVHWLMDPTTVADVHVKVKWNFVALCYALYVTVMSWEKCHQLNTTE